jgi:hypothetical protein
VHKADANQAEIVQALVKVGCSATWIEGILDSGAPDLLVGRAGRTYLLEIKSGGGRLSASQFAWHRRWRGAPVVVVRTIEEALTAVGVRVAPMEGRA